MQEKARKSYKSGFSGIIKSSAIFSALVILFVIPILAVMAFLTVKLPVLEDSSRLISTVSIVLVTFLVASAFAKKHPDGEFVSNLVRSLFLSFVVFAVSVIIGPETHSPAHSITVLALIPVAALTGTVLSQVRLGGSKKTKLDKRFRKSLK